MLDTITIPMPDDWHCHLRDGTYLVTTVAHSAAVFTRTIVMPNTLPAITSIPQAEAYYQRIIQCIPSNNPFTPLMTLYLTDTMSVETIQAAAKHANIFACKLYPAGATTNSKAGITSIENLYPIFDAMQNVDLPLLIHGEVTDCNIDIFDRESIFIDRHLQDIIKEFPNLRIVLEHITSRDAVDFISQQATNIAATITVHHLLINRNQLLAGGLKPDYYCLPIAKREQDKQALIAAVLNNNNRHFFLGTDSAPHTQSAKYHPCGCAGIYTSPVAIQLLTELFVNHNAVNQLINFTSQNGANFYQLPINARQLTLERKPWTVPDRFIFGSEYVTPFYAGQRIQWQIKH